MILLYKIHGKQINRSFFAFHVNKNILRSCSLYLDINYSKFTWVLTFSRLSKVAGERVRDNNPNITDLSDVNRPTKLAEMFKEMYDNEWTSAYEALQKSGIRNEEEIVKKLCKILKVSLRILFTFMHTIIKHLFHNFNFTLITCTFIKP